jgi:hypothetical protein
MTGAQLIPPGVCRTIPAIKGEPKGLRNFGTAQSLRVLPDGGVHGAGITIHRLDRARYAGGVRNSSECVR